MTPEEYARRNPKLAAIRQQQYERRLEALRLREVEQLSYREIGKALGVTLYRAREICDYARKEREHGRKTGGTPE